MQASLDKGQRTLLHRAVRALYPLLESETLKDNEGVVIRRAGQKRKSGALGGGGGGGGGHHMLVWLGQSGHS